MLLTRQPEIRPRLFEPRWGYMGAVEEFPFVTFVVFLIAGTLLKLITAPLGLLAIELRLLFALVGDLIVVSGYVLLLAGCVMQWMAVKKAGNTRLTHTTRMAGSALLGTAILAGPAVLSFVFWNL